MSHRRFIFALVLPLLAGTALPTQAAPDYQNLRNTIRTEHIHPGYETLSVGAQELEHSIARHCRSTEQAPDRVAVQSAFHLAYDAWQAVQHIRNGPVNVEDRHARLQFWPDKRGITDRHLRQLMLTEPNRPLDQSISDMSVAVQGFPALERLLFGETALSQHAQAPEKINRCSAAHAIADNIARIARTLFDETRNATAGTDARTETRDLFNDLVTALKFVSTIKLQDPAGSERARPFLLENAISQRSVRNVEINIRAMRALYQLLYGNADTDANTHTLIVSQFDVALNEVRALGENGVEALGQELGPVRFRSLAATLESLRELIAEDLTTVLGLSLGFNALDGD
ncbi:MAG: imelysin family protein [Rhodospirillales bacterium]